MPFVTVELCLILWGIWVHFVGGGMEGVKAKTVEIVELEI